MSQIIISSELMHRYDKFDFLIKLQRFSRVLCLIHRIQDCQQKEIWNGSKVVERNEQKKEGNNRPCAKLTDEGNRRSTTHALFVTITRSSHWELGLHEKEHREGGKRKRE